MTSICYDKLLNNCLAFASACIDRAVAEDWTDNAEAIPSYARRIHHPDP
jgi:hypothetical protein